MARLQKHLLLCLPNNAHSSLAGMQLASIFQPHASWKATSIAGVVAVRLRGYSKGSLGLQLLGNVLAQPGIALRQVANPHTAHLLQPTRSASDLPTAKC